MPTGTGLDAQLTFAQETAWGVQATPTKAVEFNSEKFACERTYLEPTGLRVGQKYKRGNRVSQARLSVSGDVEMEIATKGMGLLFKNALASAATPSLIATMTKSYEQFHVPGGFFGRGLTAQVGRPQPSDGVVKPFTYSGLKIPKWEVEIKDNSIPTLTLSFDGKAEDTTAPLATPAYPVGSSVFSFAQATLKLGGTVTTASGKTTITGGTATATIIDSISISGEAPMATDRFGIGNGGMKAEQLENDTPTITGKLSAEFSKVELYDLFTSNTIIPLQLTLVGPQIETGQTFLLDFIMPATKLKKASPNVDGPDIVSMDTDFECYSNETDPVIQVRVVSDESTI